MFALSPLVFFIGIWVIVFYLFNLKASYILQPYSKEFLWWVIVTLLVAVLAYYAGYFLNRRYPLSRGRGNGVDNLHSIVLALFFLMLPLFFINVFAAGSLPIMFYLTGVGVGYSQFGVSGINGIFNSLLILTGTLCFWLLISNNSSRLGNIILVVCLVTPIVTIHRATLIRLIIQCIIIFIYIKLRRITFKRMLLFIAMVIGMLSLFGWIGDIRTDNAIFRRQAFIRQEFEWMPTSLLWVYMYMTTPVNNFAHLTELKLDKEFGINTLRSLSPSVIKGYIINDVKKEREQYLVKRTFNISSYAFVLYLDWGWLGVISFTGLLLMTGGYVFRNLIRRGSVFDLLLLSVINKIIILTVFSNDLLNLPGFLQILLVLLLKKHTICMNAFLSGHNFTVRPQPRNMGGL